MRDPRLDKWADVLVSYSLDVQPGHHVVIATEVPASPLLHACYERLLKQGAHVDILSKYDWTDETFFAFGSDEQLSYTSPILKHAVENCDRYLYIGASNNTKALSNVPAQKQTLSTQARKPIMETIMQRAADGKMRWAYTIFPTAAAAQDSDMSLTEFEEFVFNAGYLNDEDPVAIWKRIAQQQDKLVDFLQGKKELHFQNNEGTDLTVNVDGMTWVNCCGRINFPDGEVYTGPNLKASDGGVNGKVCYSFPTVFRGVEVHDIELTFEKGGVVDAKASKGEAFLKEMIQQDEGARFVGEVAIGTNYLIQNGTKNILFDEKFGGTFHMALGKGYPQTGNTNMSALHWDMICDLRDGGEVFADGELISKNGRFVREEWPQPHE